MATGIVKWFSSEFPTDQVQKFNEAIQAALQPATDCARAAAEAASAVTSMLGSVPTPPDFADLILEARRKIAEES